MWESVTTAAIKQAINMLLPPDSFTLVYSNGFKHPVSKLKTAVVDIDRR
jgi:hypothetical protein